MHTYKLAKKSLVFVLCSFLCFSIAGCGSSYSSIKLSPKIEMDASASAYNTDSGTLPEGDFNNAVQLTEADIQKMNNNQAHMVFSSSGYLTFLEGKFYDQKVTTYEEAVSSLSGVASLIGIAAGSEFFAVYGQTDTRGYTYYVFQQRYGYATVQNATLRVIIDPDGYTCGLSSSFEPNIGIAEPEDSITADQALELVKNFYTGLNITTVYYPDVTKKVIVNVNQINYHAYAVYCDNPYMTKDFDMAYLETFVSYSGELLQNVEVASLDTDSMDAYKASDYFEGLETSTYTADVLLYNNTIRTISVPIAYNPANGLYYLCDVERKIMVADYSGFVYKGEMDFITSEDGKHWMNNHLIAYDNYIKVYDFYASEGLYSVDGSGLPILVGVNYADENGNPVNNACYCGNIRGWAFFAASNANTFSEAMDVIGHEFTHGITKNSMGNIYYQNATGAINEAYSDILGNICEMSNNATYDADQWLVGEMSGETLRSMSNPNQFQQPTSMSDKYYLPETDKPTTNNDRGGVHINTSLLSSTAYKLWLNGMPLMDMKALWTTSIELITPLSTYNDVYSALIMSMHMLNIDSSYEQVLTDAFNDSGTLTDFGTPVFTGIEESTLPSDVLQVPTGFFAACPEDLGYSFLVPNTATIRYVFGGVYVYPTDAGYLPSIYISKVESDTSDPKVIFEETKSEIESDYDDASVVLDKIYSVNAGDHKLYRIDYTYTIYTDSKYFSSDYIELIDGGYMLYSTTYNKEGTDFDTPLYYIITTMKMENNAYAGGIDGSLEQYFLAEDEGSMLVPSSCSVTELTIGLYGECPDSVLLAVHLSSDSKGNILTGRDSFIELAAADPSFVAGIIGVDSAEFTDGTKEYLFGEEFYRYPMTMTSDSTVSDGALYITDAESGGCWMICFGVHNDSQNYEIYNKLLDQSIQSIMLK